MSYEIKTSYTGAVGIYYYQDGKIEVLSSAIEAGRS
jgi:hypothetical protein